MQNLIEILHFILNLMHLLRITHLKREIISTKKIIILWVVLQVGNLFKGINLLLKGKANSYCLMLQNMYKDTFSVS